MYSIDLLNIESYQTRDHSPIVIATCSKRLPMTYLQVLELLAGAGRLRDSSCPNFQIANASDGRQSRESQTLFNTHL
jgi:hypothetical protein